MDALRKSYSQFTELLRNMTASQRATLIALPIMVLGGFLILMYRDGTGNYVPLSWGKTFSREELMLAEQSLLDAGLSEFQSKGQRIFVPSQEVERYNAALLEGGTLPSNWGAELEQQFENDGIFSSERQQQARKDIALAKELRRLIRAVPAIEDANVVWARSQGRNRWPYHQQQVTATVNVVPRRGHPLSMPLVHSLRLAVASMVPDLKPEDVTVFDQSSGTSYTDDREDDALSGRLLSRIKQFEQLHQNKILSHLAAYIPDVVVTVNVELENLKRLTERTQTLNAKTVELQLDEQRRDEQASRQPQRAEPGTVSNRPLELTSAAGTQQSRTLTTSNVSSRSIPQDFTISERELIAAMPKAVQVSIAVPSDYFRKVAIKRMAEARAGTEGEAEDAPLEVSAQDVANVEQEILENVRATAMKLIPADSPATSVNVTSFTRVEPDVEEVDVALAEQVESVLARWGSVLGLALFALWALRMVSKSMPEAQSIADAEPQPSFDELLGDDDDPGEQAPPKESSERDRLQDMVRDNPELAAAVLSRWIHPDRP